MADAEGPKYTGFDTLALHGGQQPDPTTGARAVPIYQTTSYVFRNTDHAAALFALQETGNIYTRIMNPTSDVLEQRITLLEGGIGALALSSGQAAETLAILNLCNAGENIVSVTTLYGGTYNLFHYTLPKYGIDTKFVEGDKPEDIAAAIDDGTRAVYLEAVGNPRLNIPDFQAIADVAHAKGVPVIVDNTVPTPYLLRPFEHGADIVVHSATKYIGGHGTSIGGLLVDNGKFDYGASGRFKGFTEPDPSYHGLRYTDLGPAAFIAKARVQGLRDIGPCISPFNSFLFLLGVETLSLRMDRHCSSAKAVAQFLREHGKIEWVNYPGLPDHPSYALAQRYMPKGQGGLIGFGIRGGREAGRKFIDNLKLFSHLANIGDAKSLAIHPATTTHSQLTPEEQWTTGVTDDFVRLSVGLETLDDLIADLDSALQKAWELVTAGTSMVSESVGLVERRYHTWDEPLLLESGVSLEPLTLAYEMYGELDPARRNAIVIFHALSGDAHVAGRHRPNDRKPGWWDTMVGPGKAFDTDRYCVICANVPGGCQGSTGPSSIDPLTDRRYNLRFPVVAISDMVNAQVRLLDELGIEQVAAAVGGSMGGMQVLQFAVAHPGRVRLAIPLATTACSSAQAIAFSAIGRRAITSDPRWRGGDYPPDDPPVDGLAVARMIGHMTYLSEERLEWRFGRQLQQASELSYTLEREFAIESYLEYQGRSFVDRFDANSYLYITKAMDYWDLTRHYGSLVDAFRRARARFLVASFSSDWLYPPAESRRIVDALEQAGRDVDYYALTSPLGHDAFLLETDLLTPILEEALDRTMEE